MRDIDQFSSLFWLVVGIGIAVSSLRYGFGTFHEPGPGFTTFFAGSILSFFSLILFFSKLRDRENRRGIGGLWAGFEIGKVLYVMVLLAIYSLVLRPIGFLISTFFLLFLLFRIKASYRVWTTLILSFFITAGCYVVFELWLKTQLPKGILGQII